MGYNIYRFTRKQCNVLYSTFKSGKLVPPKDCLGNVKSPGFVYRYEGLSGIRGFYLSPEEDLLNCQLGVLQEVISSIFKNDYKRAQAWLDCTDPEMLWDWMPRGVDPSKFWRAVY